MDQWREDHAGLLSFTFSSKPRCTTAGAVLPEEGRNPNPAELDLEVILRLPNLKHLLDLLVYVYLHLLQASIWVQEAPVAWLGRDRNNARGGCEK